ncbi:MAG: TerC family protein [candidate division NC10 bacterium]|nr:TerC family protein [candidate division NC10 bacterium]
MIRIDLFPFQHYWWLYAGFTAFVLLLLALDLGVFHRDAHEVRFREAAAWSAVWVSLALAFAYGLYRYALWKFPQDPRLAGWPGFDPTAAARDIALEFLTGYIVEYSLSVDNIFIFVLVLGYFAIPAQYQHRVLFYGILGALAFRAVFIALGSVLMQIHWIVLLFGAFLIFTGIKMMFAPEKGLEPEKNPAIRLFRRFVPVTPDLHNQRFFVRLNGALHATPLFITLLFVEVTDIIFAVDSVPAIYALTDEPLVVFTSNVFAILGLRAMYFMLAGAVDKFHMLKYGLSAVLIFVGLKMAWLNRWYGGKFPIGYSLVFIGSVIAASIMLSLLIPKRRAAVGRRPVAVMPKADEAVGGLGPKTVSRSESSKSSAPPR